MSDTLRASLIRLAHAKPELRPHLLPLLAGQQKRASFDFRFDLSREIGKEKAEFEEQLAPRLVKKYEGLYKRAFEAKFPKWDIDVAFKYEKPEVFGRGVTYDNGSVLISVKVGLKNPNDENVYVYLSEELEEVDNWLRSQEVHGIVEYGNYYGVDPSDFPLEGGGKATL